VIRGRPGGLFQLPGGGAVRIILASASSSGAPKATETPLWSASSGRTYEVTTLWRYTNTFIITFIITKRNVRLLICRESDVVLTRPSSLSSRLSRREFSVNSLTLIIGSGWLVVKSPCVSQLHAHTRAGLPLINSLADRRLSEAATAV